MSKRGSILRIYDNVAVFDNVCMVLWLLNDCDFAADVFPVVVGSGVGAGVDAGAGGGGGGGGGGSGGWW